MGSSHSFRFTYSLDGITRYSSIEKCMRQPEFQTVIEKASEVYSDFLMKTVRDQPSEYQQEALKVLIDTLNE